MEDFPRVVAIVLFAKQVKPTTIVDEAALNQGIFKHEGGIRGTNKLFDHPITDILAEFELALWA